ncbi:hypothetical protein MKW98_001834 [Papaver atlanticum]|uniref:Uncharacterized protein n=1 Tax=Papaver atlanticum TaxID=357466 RepID=A0AAD4XA56_9MAGN|nr:hypothetical protein MKW98_001834 [Papaver atlanticum]
MGYYWRNLKGFPTLLVWDKNGKNVGDSRNRWPVQSLKRSIMRNPHREEDPRRNFSLPNLSNSIFNHEVRLRRLSQFVYRFHCCPCSQFQDFVEDQRIPYSLTNCHCEPNLTII